MKKTVSLVLAVVMMLSVLAVAVSAGDTPDLPKTDALVYSEVISEEAKTCKIIGAAAGTVNLEIPEEINGYTVVTVDNRAFDKNPELETVKIPDTVTTIGQYAFTKTAFYKNDANWENGALYAGKFLIAVKTGISGEFTVKTGTSVMADAVFRNCKELEKIVLPEGIKAISLLAFRDCEKLAEAVLPTTLKNIGAYAFTGCIALKSVVIPEGTEELGKYSFNGSGVTSVEIPASVKVIGDYAFCNCDELAQISVNEENKNYSSSEGVLYNKDRTTLVLVPGAIDYSAVKIPETVTKIGNGAFEGAPFDEFKIPENVTSVGEAAFSNCENLEAVFIPESVTEIGETAFVGAAEDFVIVAEKDSFAYSYAEKNGVLPEFVMGDMTGEGKVTSVDARQLLQHVAMLRDLTEEQAEKADMNKDGSVDVVDARWVLQTAAGLR